MPYIDRKHRYRLDTGQEAPQGPGSLNYAVTQLIDRYLGDMPNYARINAVVGVLQCAQLEVYRRVAAPYEDGKMKRNGDVYRDRTEMLTRAAAPPFESVEVKYRRDAVEAPGFVVDAVPFSDGRPLSDPDSFLERSFQADGTNYVKPGPSRQQQETHDSCGTDECCGTCTTRESLDD